MKLFSSALFTSLIILMSCSTGDQVKQSEDTTDNIPAVTAPVDSGVPVIAQPKEYNFRFVGYDINIDDPSWDRRSYYKIFIDKVDAGRTTIGLESQKKTFESRLPSNRHLLMVEKWVLDEKKGQYVKLNNIEQPKPDYLYFELLADKVAEITLENDPLKNKSNFQVDIE